MSRASREAFAKANHPPHRPIHGTIRFKGTVTGDVITNFPNRTRGWRGVQVRRICHKIGGHWWHPADAMILWRCCVCGAVKDGMPRDGTRSDEWFW